MNTQLVILFSLFALGSVMADVYFVGRHARGQVLRFQSASVVRRTAGLKLNLALGDDTDTETETDTDSDTEIVAASASPVPASPSPIAASPSAPAASASPVAASPSAPAASASPAAASASPAAASPSRSPEPETCEAGQQRHEGKCVKGSVSGKLNMPGTAASFDEARLNAVAEGLSSAAKVDKSYVKTSLGKADTVVVVFVIYLPASATTVTLDSITANLNDLDALLIAINQALTSAGFPTVASLSVVFDPSPSPTASPSASAPVVKADSKDDSKLGDGAIAGIVIGSVAGAALLVALIVLIQMKTSQRAHARTSSKMTAQAVEAEALKGGKNSLNAQL